MWVKICGVTNEADAIAAVESGADAVGLNFYPPSPRFLELTRAVDVRNVIGQQATVVGVFVNSTVDTVVKTAETVKLDGVQFHGDETAQQLAEFHQRCPHVFMIRAFRLNAANVDQVQQSLEQLSRSNVPLYAILLDAFVPGQFGGTGHMVDFDSVHQLRQQLSTGAAANDSTPSLKSPEKDPFRIILAGGLTPDTVSSAVAAVHPWGVDTASGVESSPSSKDRSKMQQFVQHARHASSGREKFAGPPETQKR